MKLDTMNNFNKLCDLTKDEKSETLLNNIKSVTDQVALISCLFMKDHKTNTLDFNLYVNNDRYGLAISHNNGSCGVKFIIKLPNAKIIAEEVYSFIIKNSNEFTKLIMIHAKEQS